MSEFIFRGFAPNSRKGNYVKDQLTQPKKILSLTERILNPICRE